MFCYSPKNRYLKQTIYRGPGGTGEAHTDADVTEIREIMIEAQGYRDEAEAFAASTGADAAAAAASAAAALVSETNAATSEDAAADSETAAAASETAAAASEAAALASATAAAESESNAADSEAAAAASEAAAALSETNAATSEANAATSETNAAASEAAAAASEAAAAASESAAATSETNAAASETAAAASAASAASSWDSFDDRYLGAKSTDPTVDNDGNALLVGAIYWNTPSAEFRGYDGSAWASLTGLPSLDGTSGKFLYSDGTNASWENVPDPQPATPTDDGLVYGSTPNEDSQTFGGWVSLVTSNIITSVTNVTGGTQYTFGPQNTDSNFSNWITDEVGIGDHCYINDTYFGIVTAKNNGIDFTTLAETAAPFSPLSPNGSTIVWYTLTSPLVTEGGNVSLGYGSNDDNGGANTSIGYSAGSTITTGSNLTVVGYNAEPSSATATNEATLGNSDTTKTRLWGAIAVDDDTGTSGQVLTSNGSGAATWETPSAAPVTSVNGETGVVVLTAADVGAATSSDISAAIAALVDSAPATLDTLNELAAALGDDANFASTVTTALAGKASLSSPTFTGTVTADAFVGDGSGLTGIDSLPDQTGHSGEYLTTDGSSVSWAAVDALPSQTGNSGKYLTTDGTDASWATLDTDANSTTKGLYEHSNTISVNYTIGTGNNAMSAGPMTVAGGVSVTVPSGSTWVIVG